MAVVDFTTWTKVDPGANLSLTGTNQINITTISAASSGRTGYWYDGGAGWKSGNFRFRIGPVNISAASSSNSRFIVAGVTTDATTGGDSANENRPSIQVRWINTTTNPTLTLDQFRSTDSSSTAPVTTTSYQGSAIALNTNFYLDLERSGSTCTCKIYSDSGYSTLINTLSITLTEVISVRYAYAAGRFSIGSGATVTATVLNFDTAYAAVTGLTITSVTPSTFDDGKTGIVIAGSGFGASQGSSTLTIGAQTQTVTAWSDTSITFTSVRGSVSPGNAALKLTKG